MLRLVILVVATAVVIAFLIACVAAGVFAAATHQLATASRQRP